MIHSTNLTFETAKSNIDMLDHMQHCANYRRNVAQFMNTYQNYEKLTSILKSNNNELLPQEPRKYSYISSYVELFLPKDEKEVDDAAKFSCLNQEELEKLKKIFQTKLKEQVQIIYHKCDEQECNEAAERKSYEEYAKKGIYAYQTEKIIRQSFLEAYHNDYFKNAEKM
ncbi:MAG: hypothetical protein K0S74_32 [Chlamydiales bacterium]|jgi:hypothetical protein|nr:hypothetical protein [Chlamydiales bacterium]